MSTNTIHQCMSKTDINALYGEFKDEVAETRDYVRKNLVSGTREEDLYKGTMILYSELFYKPDFLFVGINPGAGYYNTSGKKFRDDELEAEDGFEYLLAGEDYPDYRSAEQTRTAFARTKYKGSLSKSVKTNLFYTSTSSLKAMRELFGILDNKFNIDYYAKSLNWTKKLIGIIEPKVIICEGKVVANTLAEYYEVEPQWNQETATFQIEGKIQVLGYKRLFSNIRNINGFVEALNNLQDAFTTPIQSSPLPRVAR